ncbi:hypothetical protein NW062_02435 [Mycoplasmopsis cynos]|nr:hypothetical protein NW062_02435 [Mycoplasmopsis cynos]
MVSTKTSNESEYPIAKNNISDKLSKFIDEKMREINELALAGNIETEYDDVDEEDEV